MSYVTKMIAEGEHQQQDFKMRVEDARKIAKTLVAFANTDGGRLLIGVKDNGSVSGVSVEEEFHMIEAAAELHCKPVVDFQTQVWKSNFKSVLEVIVEPSLKKPHFAEDHDHEWHAYQRQDDRNVRANGVLLKVWQHQMTDGINDFHYTWKVRRLFKVLTEKGKLGFKKTSNILRMGRERTENTLAQLVAWDILEMEFSDTGCFFRLKDEEKAHELDRQHAGQENKASSNL
ncbi:AlbA family DNA-binding domain-containing protein [Sanyastnella coralliicola]|uniref:AlbA family DNA-binding domain-containing protein n=1 Tax=Sanyastnella coralliicola TaxID=3069118 RepID=UPI0027B9716D|nr:ATP-binding protein [Longitalea sp. SCSIO 12813]